MTTLNTFGTFGSINPLSQEGRVACSLPMEDADLAAGNSNWTKGLQAASDWIWSANLNPAAFPNNLGRYFLHIPGVFEQQLNYSTTLIFDEPSFKNGVQISGMLQRPVRELAISLVAQRRRCWYSMTHHAILGKLTATKHGMSDTDFDRKWSMLADHQQYADVYTDLERAVLEFADAFATNPKAYSDSQYSSLRAALRASAEASVGTSSRKWLGDLKAARDARAAALAAGKSDTDALRAARAAADAARSEPATEIERLINSQIVELAFVCLQFVALTDVFTGLNVPDESFLNDVLKTVVPSAVIASINALNQQGNSGIARLVPPHVDVPLDAVLAGHVTVDAVPLKGARIPLVPYETDPAQGARDKGLTIGGAQIGVYGWSFGSHFPGSLVYAVMHHPELARYETAYSLPVLFNEDEWRNGVQTAGFVNTRFKEILFQKIYRTLRSRYGIEHHNMFLLNVCARDFGGPAAGVPKANAAAVWAPDHRRAPAGTYSASELAALDWLQLLLHDPHQAHTTEGALRAALHAENEREIDGGVRRLDTSREGGSREAGLTRLLNHQIAEMAMTAGHMDGLGRLLTILRLESEGPAQQSAGSYQDRPGLLDILKAIGLSDATVTAGELLMNPTLNDRVRGRLQAGETAIRVSAAEAAAMAEF